MLIGKFLVFLAILLANFVDGRNIQTDQQIAQRNDGIIKRQVATNEQIENVAPDDVPSPDDDGPDYSDEDDDEDDGTADDAPDEFSVAESHIFRPLFRFRVRKSPDFQL